MENENTNICKICGLEISNTDSKKQCPKCNAEFHEKCWLDGQECPNCNYKDDMANTAKQTEQICQKCKTPLKDSEEFCPKCGTKKGLAGEEFDAINQFNLQKEQSKKQKKKKIFILICTSICVLLILTGIYSYSQLPINRYKTALKNGEFRVATEIYNDNISDGKFEDKSEVVLEDFINEIKESFANGKLEYKEAIKSLNAVKENVDIATVKKVVEDVKSSQDNYIKAKEYDEKNNYYQAMKHYDLVIEDDLQNYDQALKALDRLKGLLSSELIKQSNEKKASNDMIGAYQILAEVEKEYLNQEALDALDNVKDSAISEIESTSQKMFENKEYRDAYKYLEKFDDTILSEKSKSTKKEALTKYVDGKLAEAKSQASSGNYTSALNTLKQANKEIPSSKFQPKIDEYQIDVYRTTQKVSVKSAYTYDDGYYYIFRKATVIVGNNTNQVVKEYTVGMLLFDRNGYPVESDDWSFLDDEPDNLQKGRGQSANIQPGGSYGYNRYWNTEDHATKIKACVISAEFYDGGTWYNPYYEHWLEAEKDRY